MKLSTSVFGALVALSLSAQAATVTVGNLPGNLPVPISFNGALLGSSGSVAIGTFAADSAFGSVGGIQGDFQQFGDAISVGFNGIDGLYQNTVSSTVGGSAFSGQQVFTVIGNESTIGGSSALAVIDNGFTFVDEPGATPNAVITAASGLRFGSAAQGSVGGNAFDGFALAGAGGGGPVIPEPSSALLGLLGLSFLAFRRRK